MKLYHGGLEPCPKPKILTTDRVGDFGIGFYTTSSRAQAQCFIQNKASKQNVSQGYLSCYEVPDDFLRQNSLKIKNFTAADETWIDFVLKNRRQADIDHNYDVIYGPVANDQVYASFTLFENELISKAELIERLKTTRLVDQILFHTEKSLLILKYMGSEVIQCNQ